MTGLSIVTVSHRSNRHLPAYVESFLASGSDRSPDSIEFIIVENSGAADSDRLLDPLRTAGIQVTFVESPNDGFGAGCNRGAAQARGDTLIFANPDIIFVDPLDPIAAAQDGTMWGTVAQCDAAGDSYAFDMLPEYKTVKGEIQRRYRHVLPTTPGDAKRVYPVGSFFVVASNLFHKVGGFDERFFMYHEEAELSRRLHAVAPPPTHFSDIHVKHEAFGSSVTKDAVLRHETEGLLTYARVTGRRRVILTRVLTQLLLTPVSGSARRRLRFLFEAMARKRDFRV
jgi:N-acetylglucosaminyl-diphospho-decaprenol L-rhamnosyltransferase